MKTTLAELPGSRLRVQVEVPAAELDASVERKAHELARNLKLPGFRRGKVPPQLVVQRLGREAVLEQAVRDALPRWYAGAIESAGVVPVGDPDIDLGSLPPEGGSLEFSIEIGVLPQAQLGSYDDLEVPRREPIADDELVDAEVELVRDRLARLHTVARPAAQGDFVVLDYRGRLAGGQGSSRGRGKAIPGGEARDQLIELGAGNLLPGFEEGLLGAGAGEERTLEVTFPADYPNRQLAGHDAQFEATVKDVKEKQLPEVDEDFAQDAGFDSVAQLREDIRARLLAADEARVEAEFERAALDALAERAQLALTPELIKARAKEMWERMLRALERQGISPQAYAQVSGRNEQDALAELEPDAERALRREAVLTALVADEGIEVTDEDLLALVAPAAEREGVAPEQLLGELSSAGRSDELREQESARRALAQLAQRARPISVAQAHAREKLWTPERVAEPAGAAVPGRLWTPDDPAAGS
ncbi:MAG TPA: trigger factor [Solirubrobacteraceae bacterium]|nr:trigger factor [Solirubrobacteraceae bacterium]